MFAIPNAMKVLTLAVAIALAVGAFGGAAGGDDSSKGPGAVYALTNSTTGNEVLVYQRDKDGSLEPAGSFATGGNGSGSGLGSQNAVIVSDDHQLLFAVNAGSNSVSSFRIHPGGGREGKGEGDDRGRGRSQALELVSTVPSGGLMPTSVAFHRGGTRRDDDKIGKGLLYVLNAGAPNNITGFTVGSKGELKPLPDSTRRLSANSTSPAQVGFDDDGRTVIVTERSTDLIDTYAVGKDGRLSKALTNASAGPVPFGFAVNGRNTLIVSEAGEDGGASTYVISRNSGLTPVSSNLKTGQTAACWAVVTKNGRFAYVTNAGTGNISGFAIDRDGSASLVDADGVTGVTGGNPTDAALSHNSRYLYARISATNSIAIFKIESDGSLGELPPLTGTPDGLAGLAAY